MPVSHARITTSEASRLIKRLLTHWGHKFPVTLGEASGTVAFDTDTRAIFDADDTRLSARIEAADDARLARMQQVVAEHLQRMARAGALDIAWQPDAP